MLRKYLSEVYELMQTHCKVIGITLAGVLTIVVFAVNLYGGPLSNLNDMHNWSNRLIFTFYAAIVHFSLLFFIVLEPDKDIGKIVCRELLITISLIIMFMAMNQKTYAYNSQIQPIVRAMDTKALWAIPNFSTNYSIPAITLYYLLTRGPIYDMYLAKLFCIGCYELLCICAARISRIISIDGEKLDNIKKDWRSECAFAFTLILPQGFLSAACAAQIEVAGVLFASIAFILLEQRRIKTGLITFGLGAAICTGLWLLTPIYVLYHEKWKLKLRDAFIPLIVALMCCVPSAIAGSGMKALGSLLSCFTTVPMAGSGVPNLVSFFPRAVLEEIPEYSYLRAVPVLDLVTLAADNYKETHFVILMHGLSFACLAVYMGTMVYILRRNLPDFCKILLLILVAFICAPSVTMGAWQMISIMCIFGIIFIPALRLPCVLILFATAGGCGYPVTGETMIKPPYVSIIAIIAVGMLMDFWPGKGTYHHDQ